MRDIPIFTGNKKEQKQEAVRKQANADMARSLNNLVSEIKDGKWVLKVNPDFALYYAKPGDTVVVQQNEPRTPRYPMFVDFEVGDHRRREIWKINPQTTIKWVHSRDDCKGRTCSIHNQSRHPLAKAPMAWNYPQLYRICQHALAHPDYDDVQYRLRSGVGGETACTCSCRCCGLPGD